ncbi:MAG: acyltransferase [Chthoniobacterales bacterium]
MNGQTAGTASAAVFDPRLAMRARHPGLDLLRALAIVLVVLYHAGLFGFVLPFRMERFGWIGVDLFFVLSGYLIAGQLLSPLAAGKRLDIAQFYARRALRILPAFLAIVAIYVFLPQLREYPRMPPVWKFLTFTQNLGLRGGTAFSHAWSLCIEGQFYLLLPFVVMALARFRRGHLAIPCGIVLGGVILRALLAQRISSSPHPSFGEWQQLIYYPTYARLDPLTIGVSLAAIERFRPDWWSTLMKSARWIWAPGIAAIVVALILAEDGLNVPSSTFDFPLIAFGVATMLVTAVSPELPFSRIPLPGAAFLATIAYSIYLSHKLVIHALQNACSALSVPLISWRCYLCMLAAILLAGSVLFFAIERPFLLLRQRYVRRQRAAGLHRANAARS